MGMNPPPGHDRAPSLEHENLGVMATDKKIDAMNGSQMKHLTEMMFDMAEDNAGPLCNQALCKLNCQSIELSNRFAVHDPAHWVVIHEYCFTSSIKPFS